MDELTRALGDINSIRRQVANTTEFHGYGPATLACTGLLALIAAGVQGRYMTDESDHLPMFLVIWISTAVVAGLLTAVQMRLRVRRMHSVLPEQMIRMAVEQFLPAIGVGLLLTIVLAGFVPQVAWMLPGLWQIIFSLGIFSSCRFLPRAMFVAGFWYLFTGLVCLSMGTAQALSPYAMGLPFCVGQLLVATVLLFGTSETPVED